MLGQRKFGFASVMALGVVLFASFGEAHAQRWRGGFRGRDYYGWRNNYGYYQPYVVDNNRPIYYGNYYGVPTVSNNGTMQNAPSGVVSQSNYGSVDKAQLTVIVPSPDTQIWLDQTEMQPRGIVRQFITPALEPSKQYSYTVKAKWKDPNNQLVEVTRTVDVMPGQLSVVDFNRRDMMQRPMFQRR